MLSFELLVEQIRSELSDYRMTHVMGVVEESRRLADIHHIDRDKAEIAALLHDCTKEWEEKKQLQLIEKSGIIVERELLTSRQLLHPLSGSIRAKQAFGVDDEIASAIRWHTTGRKDMSKLELLIYVADMVEQTRSFKNEVAYIRKIAERSLERAAMEEAKRVIDVENARGRLIHPKTVETYLYYKSIIENGGSLC